MGRLIPLGAPTTEDDILNNPDFAVLRKMLMRQGQPLPPETNVDEELPPQYEVDENGALSSAVPTEDSSEDTASFGALPASGSVRDKLNQYQTLAAKQAAFYDQMEKELLARRAGPSKREQYFQMAAALLQPTAVRGFAGSMANLTPVLQQQAQQRREGEISRADALQKLRMAQLAGQKELLGQELDTEVALARIAKQGGVGQTYDEKRGIFANRNNPRPTENTYTIKGTQRTLVQWQDGLWREPLPSGGYKVFERAGNTFNELQPEGAR